MSLSRLPLVNLLTDHFEKFPSEKQDFILNSKIKIEAGQYSRLFDTLPCLIVDVKLRILSIELGKIIQQNKSVEITTETERKARNWLKGMIKQGCDDFFNKKGQIHPELSDLLGWTNQKIDFNGLMRAYVGSIFACVAKNPSQAVFHQATCYPALNSHINSTVNDLIESELQSRCLTDGVEKFFSDHSDEFVMIGAGLGLAAAVVGGISFFAMSGKSSSQETIARAMTPKR